MTRPATFPRKLALFGALFLASSCNDKKPTSITVAVTTEASVPRELDRLELVVTRPGTGAFDQVYDLTQAARVLPGTLAVVDGDPSDTDTPVHVHVQARKTPGSDFVVLRSATLGFQSEHQKLLRMPLRLSCFDRRDCDESKNETCVGGRCADDHLDVTLLPDLESVATPIPDPAPPMRTPGTTNECFFEGECLTNLVARALDADRSFDPGLAIGTFNVALVWAAADDGRPTVLVPNADEGFTVNGSRVVLAQGIYYAVTTGKATGPFVSSACATIAQGTEACALESRSLEAPPPGTGGGGGSGGASGGGGASGHAGAGGANGGGGHAGTSSSAGTTGSGGVAGGPAGGAGGSGGQSGNSGSGGAGGGGTSAAGGFGGASAAGASAVGGFGGTSGASGQSGASGSGGCNNLECQQITCPGSGTTTISGTVFGPGGKTPIPGALVYVPNSAVQPLPSGVGGCVPATGSPLVSSKADDQGRFTITDAPAGAGIPLVIQAGRWRKQQSVALTACQDNPLSAEQGRLPAKASEGDMPHIAVSTGTGDDVECTLRDIGVDLTEFGAQGSAAHVHLYEDTGGKVNGSTPATALWDTPATMSLYDTILFACPATATTKSNPELSNFGNWANAGGRAILDHDAYVWVATSTFFGGAAAMWTPGQMTPNPPTTGVIDVTSAEGQLLSGWLQSIGASSTPGQLLLSTERVDTASLLGASVPLISDQMTGKPVLFLMGAPFGGSPPVGEVAYADLHGGASAPSAGLTFPAYCPSAMPVTTDERPMEFLLFDVPVCVE